MNAVEWNKKEELVAEQALKHLKVRGQQGTVLAADQLQLLTVQHVGSTCHSPRFRPKVYFPSKSKFLTEHIRKYTE